MNLLSRLSAVLLACSALLFTSPAKAAIEPLSVDISSLASFVSTGVTVVGGEEVFYVLQTNSPFEQTVSIEWIGIFGNQVPVPTNANGIVLLATPFGGPALFTTKIDAGAYTEYLLTETQGIFLPFSTPRSTTFGFQVTVGSLASTVSEGAYFQVLGFNTVAAPVPEPTTLAMFLAGFVGVGAIARRRRQGCA